MAIELKETDGGKLLEVSLTGKLVKEDYDAFVPAVDRASSSTAKSGCSL